MPFDFLPDIPDQKYYRLGEAPLVGCLRDAVREVCRERWRHVTHVDGWTQYLYKNRYSGQVGQDTNQDGNDVEGLIDYVRTESERHNVTQHWATNDTAVCSGMVDRFTDNSLVDEIILSWAVDEGHVSGQVPFQPMLEKRFNSSEAPSPLAHKMGDDPKNTTDSDNVAILWELLELLERLFPENATGVPESVSIPRNSTHRVNSTRDDVDWDLLFPDNSTAVLRSVSIPHNSTGRGDFTLPDDLRGWPEQPRNSSTRVPVNSTRSGDDGLRIIFKPAPGQGPLTPEKLREIIDKFRTGRP